MNDASRARLGPRAMVLAAGLGKRMRPITATTPKPLVRVGGKSLIDHALDRIEEAGIHEAVINVHYLADLVETHLRRRRAPRVIISDERAGLLETGGGVKKALPLLGSDPFLLFNSDSLWIEGPRSNVRRMAEFWAPDRMDILLLLAATVSTVAYGGRGDFRMDVEGRLIRRAENQVAPFIYAGVAIFKPELFAGTPDGPFSLNRLFDQAAAAERLYGLRLDGRWIHVGTPEAVRRADDEIAASAQ
jgi:MurNAc alpha-1-phosphate uridylyltransferase